MLKKLLKNKKGFTMVELLATIVILGVLFSVGIASVQSVINKSHKTYDNKQLELFSGAARSYFADNPKEQPSEVFEKNKVTLKQLQDGKYIGVIRDSNGEKCNAEKSYVVTQKYAKGKYAYDASLVCNNETITEDDNSQDATIVFESVSSYSTHFKQKVYIDTKNNTVTGTSSPTTFEALGQEVNPDGSVYYTNDKVNIKFSINTNVGIGSYQYYIYKKIGNDYKEYKRSEAVEVPDESKKIYEEVSLSKDDISDGTYKLKAIIYDIKGHRTEAESTDSIVLDTEKPTCNVTASGINGESGWFKEEKADITIDIKDDNPYLYSLSNNDQTNYYMSAYKKIKGTKLQGNTTNEGISWNGKVVDRAGNVGNCTSENVMVDTKAPTCTLSGGSEEWKKDDVTITATCTDNESGCLENQNLTYTYEANSYFNTDKAGLEGDGLGGSVVDKAGNVGECSPNQKVKIDGGAPECKVTLKNKDGSSYNEGEWTNQNVIATKTCTDEGVGCTTEKEETEFGNDGSSRTYKTYPTVFTDKLGNETTCPAVTIRIDKKAPTCSLSAETSDGKAYTEGEWTNQNVTVKRTCTDEHSGCASEESTSLLNKSTPFTGERTAMTEIYDNAGNSTKCPAMTVKIDKTPPTCSVSMTKKNSNNTYSAYNSEWTKSDVTVTATCSDTLSGCNKTPKNCRGVPEGQECPTENQLNNKNQMSQTYSINSDQAKITTNAGANTNEGNIIYDNAGNTALCSQNSIIKQDKKAPTCSLSVDESSLSSDYPGWYEDFALLRGVASDNDSGLYMRGILSTNSPIDNDQGIASVIEAIKGSGANSMSLTKKTTTPTDEDGKNWRLYAIDNAKNACKSTVNAVKVKKKGTECELDLSGPEGENDWYKGDVTATIKNKNGSSQIVGYQISIGDSTIPTTWNSWVGSTAYNGDKNFKKITKSTNENGIGVYGFIKYQDGSYVKCGKVVKIDKEPPTCTVSAIKDDTKTYTPGDWTNQNVTVLGTCSDNQAPCDSVSKTTNVGDEEIKEGTENPGTVMDQAGNKTACTPIDVNIDKKAPTCKIETEGEPTGVNNWYNKQVKVIIGSINEDNDISTTSISNGANTWPDENHIQYVSTPKSGTVWSGKVVDKAGNVGNCTPKTIKVDTTQPTISIEKEGANSKGWNKTDFNLKVKTHVGVSGGKIYGYWEKEGEPNRDPATTDENGLTHLYPSKYFITDYGQEGDKSYTTDDFSKERNEKRCYMIVGNSGNTAKSCIDIKLDKTPPTLNKVGFGRDDFGNQHNNNTYVIEAWDVNEGGIGSGLGDTNVVASSDSGLTRVDKTNKYELKKYYLASGIKNTQLILYDKAGNVKETKIPTLKCVCRKRKDGKVVHTEKDSPDWTCENAHNPYKAGELYTSCSKK